MKILMLVDLVNNWAIHNRAKAFQKFLPDHQFEIRAGLRNESCLEDQRNFDLIHFNFTYGITDYYDFIIQNKHRCVITVVNERSLLSGFGVDVVKLENLLISCPWVTSLSKKIAENMSLGREFPPFIQYIPNGIDEDIFYQYRTIVAGYAGTDKENKNVSVIREACRQLGVTLKTAHYNDGVPTFSHADMNKFYVGLDVYIHASLTEGFNNTVIEALACNVPVLMTRQGCWEEFEGYVTYIEPTVESIMQALRPFQGRRLIMDRFLWGQIMPRYKAIYEEAHQCTKT